MSNYSLIREAIFSGEKDIFDRKEIKIESLDCPVCNKDVLFNEDWIQYILECVHNDITYQSRIFKNQDVCSNNFSFERLVFDPEANGNFSIMRAKLIIANFDKKTFLTIRNKREVKRIDISESNYFDLNNYKYVLSLA